MLELPDHVPKHAFRQRQIVRNDRILETDLSYNAGIGRVKVCGVERS